MSFEASLIVRRLYTPCRREVISRSIKGQEERTDRWEDQSPPLDSERSVFVVEELYGCRYEKPDSENPEHAAEEE